jgi:hypothetical protein
MNCRIFHTLIVMATVALGAAGLGAAENAPPPTTRPLKLVRFIPKTDDAPADLQAAVGRGGQASEFDPALKYTLLVPYWKQRGRAASDVKFTKPWGVTTQQSPSLFWFTNRPTRLTALIVITQGDTPEESKVVYETKITDPLACGIQRLDLSKVDVKLTSGVQYHWSVQYISSDGRRPREKMIGEIKRLETADPRVARISAADDDAQRLALCAELGIWYDLLAALSDRIDQHPGDADARWQRSELLDTTGAMRLSEWIESGLP